MQASWVEIPVANIDRAIQFYSKVFAFKGADTIDQQVRKIAILAGPADGRPGVSLTQTAGFQPGATGPLPYFFVGDNLDTALNAISQSGGKVVEAKAPRGDLGFFALVHDSEGNLLTLHGTN